MNEDRELIENLEKASEKVYGRLFDQARDLDDSIRDTMRNLAIASGALAAAGIAALGTPLKIDPPFVLLGIVVLLVNSFLVFLRLNNNNQKAAQDIIHIQESFLKPTNDLIALFKSAEKSNDWNKYNEEKGSLFDRIQGGTKIEIVKDDTAIFTTLFGAGALFIGLGILLPHLCALIR